jgi:hypothetical protein
MLYQIDFYWLLVGMLLLGLLNIYSLSILWRRSFDNHRKATVDGVPFSLRDPARFFLAPAMATIVMVASFSMLLLGYSPEASTENIKLHGDAFPSQAAIEAQLREEQELHLHTKSELARMREQWNRVVRLAEQERFDSEVEEGEKHMLERRKKLMERDK